MPFLHQIMDFWKVAHFESDPKIIISSFYHFSVKYILVWNCLFFQIGSDIAPILEAVVKTLHLLIRHFKKTSKDFDEVSQVRITKLFLVFFSQYLKTFFIWLLKSSHDYWNLMYFRLPSFKVSTSHGSSSWWSTTFRTGWCTKASRPTKSRTKRVKTLETMTFLSARYIIIYLVLLVNDHSICK